MAAERLLGSGLQTQALKCKRPAPFVAYCWPVLVVPNETEESASSLEGSDTEEPEDLLMAITNSSDTPFGVDMFVARAFLAPEAEIDPEEGAFFPECVSLQGHQTAVCALAIHDQGEGKLPVVASVSDDVLVFWDMAEVLSGVRLEANGTFTLRTPPVGRVLNSTFGPVHFCSFNATGELLAVCINDKANASRLCISFNACGQVSVVDVAMGRAVAHLEGHNATVHQARFLSRSPRCLLTVSADRTFKLWDLDSGSAVYQSSILSSSPLLTSAVNRATLLPHDCFAVGAANGQVRVFMAEDANEGQQMPCRLLHTFDVVKQCQELSKAKSPSRTKTPARTAVTISSRPLWKRAAPAMDESNTEEDAGTEHAEATLALAFSPLVTHQRPSVAEKEAWLHGSAALLSVVTSTSFFSFDLATFEPLHRKQLTTSVGFCGAATLEPCSRVEEQTALFCTFAPAFEGSLHTGWLSLHSRKHAREDESVAVSPFCPYKWSEEKTEEEDEKCPVLPANSALRNWTFRMDNPLAVKKKGTRRSRSSGRRRHTTRLDAQPLVFHKQIKSSGYGSKEKTRPPGSRLRYGGPRRRSEAVKSETQPTTPEPPPPAMLFIGGCEGNVPESVCLSAPVYSAPRVEYPTNCKLVKHFQAQNSANSVTLHSGRGIISAQFSPLGTRLLSCALDGTARWTRLPTAKHNGEGVQLVGHTGPIRAVDMSARTRRIKRKRGAKAPTELEQDAHRVIATGGTDRTVRLWLPSRRADSVVTISSCCNQKPHDKAKNRPLPGEIAHVKFCLLDRFVAVSSRNEMRLFKFLLPEDLPAGSEFERLKNREKSKYKCVFHHQVTNVQSVSAMSCVNQFVSHLMLLGSSARSIQAVDLATGQTVLEMPNVHTKPVHTLSMNGSVTLTDPSTSATHLFLSAAYDGCVKLWDLRVARTAQSCVRQFRGHINRQQPIGVSFSPCMRYVATGSEDNRAYLFDITSGTYVERLPGHKDVVSAVVWNPRHPQLATASYDGKIRFYADTASAKPRKR